MMTLPLSPTWTERLLLRVLRETLVATAALSLLVAVVAFCVGAYEGLMVQNAQIDNGERVVSAFQVAADWWVAAGAFGYFIAVLFLYFSARMESNLRALVQSVDWLAERYARHLLLVATCTATLMLLPREVSSQSFDCRKATTSVEKIICADAEIGKFDIQMAERYRTLRGAVSRNVTDRQRQWLTDTRNVVTTAADLKQVYLNRLEELNNSIDCSHDDWSTQSLMNVCSYLYFLDLDAQLKALYPSLDKAPCEQSNPLVVQDYRQALRAEAEAWEQSRSATCEIETADSEGGSIHALELNDCMYRLTAHQIKVLEGALECEVPESRQSNRAPQIVIPALAWSSGITSLPGVLTGLPPAPFRQADSPPTVPAGAPGAGGVSTGVREPRMPPPAVIPTTGSASQQPSWVFTQNVDPMTDARSVVGVTTASAHSASGAELKESVYELRVSCDAQTHVRTVQVATFFRGVGLAIIQNREQERAMAVELFGYGALSRLMTDNVRFRYRIDTEPQAEAVSDTFTFQNSFTWKLPFFPRDQLVFADIVPGETVVFKFVEAGVPTISDPYDGLVAFLYACEAPGFESEETRARIAAENEAARRAEEAKNNLARRAVEVGKEVEARRLEAEASGTFGGGAYRPSEGVTLPKILRKVNPQYTPDAMRAGVRGTIELEALVLPDGTVGDVRVVGLDFQRGKKPKSITTLDLSNHLFGLDQEAIQAVKKWKFAPGTKDSVPVPVLVGIELTFTLR